MKLSGAGVVWINRYCSQYSNRVSQSSGRGMIRVSSRLTHGYRVTVERVPRKARLSLLSTLKKLWDSRKKTQMMCKKAFLFL